MGPGYRGGTVSLPDSFLIADLAANIVARQPGPFEMERGPKICLPLLIAETRVFVESSGIAWERIIGIGIGIPGPLDARLHSLSSPPGMANWDGVDVWQTLSETFHLPIYMDNDANMGAVSESRYGAARGALNMAYLKIGTGDGVGSLCDHDPSQRQWLSHRFPSNDGNTPPRKSPISFVALYDRCLNPRHPAVVEQSCKANHNQRVSCLSMKGRRA